MVRKQEMAERDLLEEQNVWLGLVDLVVLPAETLSRETISMSKYIYSGASPLF